MNSDPSNKRTCDHQFANRGSFCVMCGWDSDPLWGLETPYRIALGLLLIALAVGLIVICGIQLSAPTVHVSPAAPSPGPGSRGARTYGIGVAIGLVLLWYGAKALFGNKDRL